MTSDVAILQENFLGVLWYPKRGCPRIKWYVKSRKLSVRTVKKTTLKLTENKAQARKEASPGRATFVSNKVIIKSRVYKARTT